MADSVRAALHERISLQTVIGWVVLVATLWWIQGQSLVGLGTSLATATILGLADIGADVYDLPSAVKSLGLGLVTLLSGLVLFMIEGGLGVSVVLFVSSIWIVLDSVQTLRHEGHTTDESEEPDGHAVYHQYVTRRVHETLREQELTRLELSAALESDDEAIDRALETLTERGVLSRNGSELHVSSPPKPGPMEYLRNGITDAFARLARPITIEFESETADEDTDIRRQSVEAHNDDRERESV